MDIAHIGPAYGVPGYLLRAADWPEALFDQPIITLLKFGQLYLRESRLFVSRVIDTFLDFQEQIEQVLLPSP